MSNDNTIDNIKKKLILTYNNKRYNDEKIIKSIITKEKKYYTDTQKNNKILQKIKIFF